MLNFLPPEASNCRGRENAEIVTLIAYLQLQLSANTPSEILNFLQFSGEILPFPSQFSYDHQYSSA